MFTRMGTEAFAARAEREGLSNREIGARLFIAPTRSSTPFARCSPSSNITSRNQLAQGLSDGPGGERVAYPTSRAGQASKHPLQ
jgi:hypothetical protein